MVRLSLTVTEELKARAEAQAADRGFPSLDAYVASLVDADRAVPVGIAIERDLLAALATPAREMTPTDWDEMRRRYREGKGRPVSRRLFMHDAARADVDDIAAGTSLEAGLRFDDAVQVTCEFLAEYPNVGTRRTAADSSLKNLRSYAIRGFRNYLISFIALSDGVIVLRVRHGSRDNDAWLEGRAD